MVKLPSTVQCWVRFLELPREYWSHNIPFAIASCLETPLRLDAAASKCSLERSFGHFVRVLADIDLFTNIRHKLWVERKGYSFLINVVWRFVFYLCVASLSIFLATLTNFLFIPLSSTLNFFQINSFSLHPLLFSFISIFTFIISYILCF